MELGKKTPLGADTHILWRLLPDKILILQCFGSIRTWVKLKIVLSVNQFWIKAPLWFTSSDCTTCFIHRTVNSFANIHNFQGKKCSELACNGTCGLTETASKKQRCNLLSKGYITCKTNNSPSTRANMYYMYLWPSRLIIYCKTRLCPCLLKARDLGSSCFITF